MKKEHFAERLYTKYDGVMEKLFSGPFLKNQNCAYLSIIQLLSVVHQVESYQNI